MIKQRLSSFYGRTLFPIKRMAILGRMNYSETSSPVKSSPKVFKASGFAQPAGTNLDDFKLTKLIKGKTDLKIAITEKAGEKLTEISNSDKNPDSVLRIMVESGGCHGFQYNLKVADLKEEIARAKEEEIEDELLVFKRDQVGQNAQIVLDESSLEILQDSKIDYVNELIGSQFKVVDSPYTSTACGCGASFDFDFEKLEENKKKRSKGL